MKTTAAPIIITAAAFACSASADFIGWTATHRAASGGTIVNVFAVTTSANDRLVNVYGGRPSNPGFITTDAPGGFLQGAGAQGAFRPDGSQSWDAPDSFLTIGGGFDASTGAWTANGATLGDPGWLYAESDGSMSDGFGTLPSSPATANPWTNAIPSGAGWYALGTGAVARSLASLSANRLPHEQAGGVRYGASSAAAAAGSFGMLVAQLFVAELHQSKIVWNMGATIRRANGTVQQGEFAFTITQVPAPGVAALVACAGAWPAARRRRR